MILNIINLSSVTDKDGFFLLICAQLNTIMIANIVSLHSDSDNGHFLGD